MNKNLNHKGASKRKGAAVSEELTEKGPVDGMDESGAGKKKGAAQEMSSREKILAYGKKVASDIQTSKSKDRTDRGNAFLLDSTNLEKMGQGDEAKDIYGTNYGQISQAPDGSKSYIGTKTSKEVASGMGDEYFDSVLKNYKGSEFYKEGANRMGFTQNFGAARQNGYAKGAAKVASIMNFGAAKAKGAAEYGGKKGDDSKSKKDYEK